MLTINMWSRKHGEIKRFLESYYDRKVEMDEKTKEWEYVFCKPTEAVDLISAVIDNSDKYQISMCIQLDDGQLHHITADNHNDIIKGIFQLFYYENVMALN
jgi:hypothetical protein